MEKSEFGKGFVYNLILFAKHWGQFQGDMRLAKETNMQEGHLIHTWFNGASDHFYELEIPEKLKDTKIGKLAKKLQDRVLEYGHGFKTSEITRKQFDEVFSELEKLAMLIDEYLNIKSIEATWS